MKTIKELEQALQRASTVLRFATAKRNEWDKRHLDALNDLTKAMSDLSIAKTREGKI